jgi:hypothetical protein
LPLTMCASSRMVRASSPIRRELPRELGPWSLTILGVVVDNEGAASGNEGVAADTRGFAAEGGRLAR